MHREQIFPCAAAKMFSSEEGLDPFENVKVSLQSLSEHDTPGKEDQSGASSSSGAFHGARFSMEELKRMEEAYTKEAKRLQAEVNDLEDDLDNEHTAALSIPSSTLDLLRRILKMKPDGDQGMLNMHKMQSSLSGVHLTDATTQVTSNNPHRIIRLQRLEGTCSQLGFAATFQVEETLVNPPIEEQQRDSDNIDIDQEVRRAVIKKLDLEVDPCCLGEMVTFLKEAERVCDLQPFLRGYAEYARWFQHRVRTFTHFKKLYPETVSLPEGTNGTTLQIMCPQQRGIIYTITWKIEMAGSGKATPKVSLSVKSAKEVSKLDSKKTLNRAPEEFRQMVGVMGVEKALETFLRAVALI